MNLEAFQSLGRILDRKYRQVNYDDRQFPEIAESTLRDWEPPDFNLADISEFLLSTTIKQQPRTEFSNLPVTVFHSPEFYIELLIWTDATTAIHQHSFCGAFQVLLGSSLHSSYAFMEEHRVSTLFLLGKVGLLSVEPLAVGDIRQIRSGGSGLVHALYHLDEPSVTLVVRTHGEPWAQPQYSLYPPTVAAAVQTLEKDSRVQLACRAFNTWGRLSSEEVREAWCRSIIQLDFPRLFAICLRLQEELSSTGLRDRLLSLISTRNPELAKHLELCWEERSRTQSLISCRASVTDPELRFFIALLLNARSRSQILCMVEHRYPNRSTVECCIDWLAKLADPKSFMTALYKAGNSGGWAGGPSQFALRLVRAHNSIPAEAVLHLHGALVRGESEEQFHIRIRDIFDGAGAEGALKAYGEYRSLPELRALTTE